MKIWQCPIHHDTLCLIKYELQIRVSVFQTVSFHLWVLCKKWLAHFLFIRNNKKNVTIKHVSKKNDRIFHIFIRFQEYCCKSGLAIFPWRVIWKYAYSPFNNFMIIVLKSLEIFRLHYIIKWEFNN